MSKYTCFQGYFDCLCIRGGSLGDTECPQLCLFVEGCCCNCLAISASRQFVADKFNLGSDPCDYRLIRVNNYIQVLSCFCDLLAIFSRDLRQCARIVDWIADLVYHSVSGCMTAQVANELDYQSNLESSVPMGFGAPVMAYQI
jgi:hypothetical protein